MTIPDFPSSGRRPHLWRIRADGYRELLLSKRWTMHGGYASKKIHRRDVMVTIAEKHADYFLCRFQLKDDFWARISADHRAREASQRRSSFRLIQSAPGVDGTTASDEMNRHLAEGEDDAVDLPAVLADHIDFEPIQGNKWNLETGGQILADRLLQVEGAGLILDGERHARLSREAERRLEQLRLAFPEFYDLEPNLDYEPGVLAADFDPETVERLLRGAYRKQNRDPRFGDPHLDALAERLGLWRAEFHEESVLKLFFREYFSVKRGVAALKELAGVVYAEASDSMVGDQPDLAGAPAGDDGYVFAVRGGYNARTGNRKSRGFRFFVVSDAGVILVSAQEASRSPDFRAVVRERGWRRKLRWPIRDRE